MWLYPLIYPYKDVNTTDTVVVFSKALYEGYTPIRTCKEALHEVFGSGRILMLKYQYGEWDETDSRISLWVKFGGFSIVKFRGFFPLCYRDFLRSFHNGPNFLDKVKRANNSSDPPPPPPQKKEKKRRIGNSNSRNVTVHTVLSQCNINCVVLIMF